MSPCRVSPVGHCITRHPICQFYHVFVGRVETKLGCQWICSTIGIWASKAFYLYPNASTRQPSNFTHKREWGKVIDLLLSSSWWLQRNLRDSWDKLWCPRNSPVWRWKWITRRFHATICEWHTYVRRCHFGKCVRCVWKVLLDILNLFPGSKSISTRAN